MANHLNAEGEAGGVASDVEQLPTEDRAEEQINESLPHIKEPPHEEGAGDEEGELTPPRQP